MKTAIILHGLPTKEEFFSLTRPSPSNAQWLPWLQKQLGLQGITAQTPEMPDAYIPDYEKWKLVFEQYTLDDETVLVGHSCGGGFLVRWLSEHQIKVAKTVLVAPWIDPEKELGEDSTFFKFTIDSTLVQKTKRGITVFSSTNDDRSIITSIEIIKSSIQNVTVREFPNAGHFCIEDGYKEFPALLEEIT